MLWTKIFVAILVSLFVFNKNEVDGLKILIHSTTISKSHMSSNGRIADTLAAAGHNVTILEAETGFIKSNSYLSSKLAPKIVLSGYDTAWGMKLFEQATKMYFEPDKSLFRSIYEAFIDPRNGFFSFMAFHCNYTLSQNLDQLKALRAENYDIYMTEQYDFCSIGFHELIKPKAWIWISSCPLIDYVSHYVGFPALTSIVPTTQSTYYGVSDDMTFLERTHNALEYIREAHTARAYIAYTECLYRTYVDPNFPPLREIIANASAVFIAANEFLAFPRPIGSNVVYIGGDNVNMDNKELGEPWTTEIAKGKKGAVFYSLGSAHRSNFLDLKFKKNVLDTFASLPDYQFFVKLDPADDEGRALAAEIPNVKVVTWVPQTALLKDDRLKAFITHAGYNSLVEAAFTATPIVSLPMINDNFANAKVAERNGFGRSVDKRLLLKSNKEFREALVDVLENPSYKQHAIRLRNLLQKNPTQPSERLVTYTEFIGEFGQLTELQFAGRNLDAIRYHNLDVFAAALAVVVLVVVGVIVAGYYVLRLGVKVLMVVKFKSE